MKKTLMIGIAATAATLALAVPSSAAKGVKPPASYKGQWWTHPLGCEYSRAGRPGETMWFLILNTARNGCPSYIAGKTWGGVYKTEGSKMRTRD